MNYYIAIYESVFPVSVLTNADVFKDIEGKDPEKIEDLKVFSSFLSAKRFIKGKTVNHKGKDIEAFPSHYSLMGPYVHVDSYRTEKPKRAYFLKEDVQNAISKGNDQFTNLLAVDENANVFLIPDTAHEMDYAVRNGESFIAGNNYVGLAAGQDDQFIQNEYERLLSAWALHLSSGGRRVSAEDYYQEINVEQTIKSIEEIIENKY